MKELELLTTSHCHLCQQAEALLARALPGWPVTRVDIAEDDDLIERYGERIPVVRCGARELAWPFSLLDLRQLVS